MTHARSINNNITIIKKENTDKEKKTLKSLSSFKMVPKTADVIFKDTNHFVCIRILLCEEYYKHFTEVIE